MLVSRNVGKGPAVQPRDQAVFWQHSRREGNFDETDRQNEADILMDMGEDVVWMELDGESSKLLGC